MPSYQEEVIDFPPNQPKCGMQGSFAALCSLKFFLLENKQEEYEITCMHLALEMTLILKKYGIMYATQILLVVHTNPFSLSDRNSSSLSNVAQLIDQLTTN